MSVSQRQYAFQRENAVPGGSPRLAYVSRAQYSPEWNSSLHTHGCAELFFITGGHGRFRTRREEFPVAIHDAVIVNANVPHTEVSQLDSGGAGDHGRGRGLCPASPSLRLGGADGLPPPDAPGGGGGPAGL